MTPDEFAAMTQRVIADQGFEDFQPTACYPARRHVKALAGLPPNIEVESASLEWAESGAQDGEEVLVAFKSDETHFKIIRRATGESEAKTHSVAS